VSATRGGEQQRRMRLRRLRASEKGDHYQYRDDQPTTPPCPPGPSTDGRHGRADVGHVSIGGHAPSTGRKCAATTNTAGTSATAATPAPIIARCTRRSGAGGANSRFSRSSAWPPVADSAPASTGEVEAVPAGGRRGGHRDHGPGQADRRVMHDGDLVGAQLDQPAQFAARGGEQHHPGKRLLQQPHTIQQQVVTAGGVCAFVGQHRGQLRRRQCIDRARCHHHPPGRSAHHICGRLPVVHHGRIQLGPDPTGQGEHPEVAVAARRRGPRHPHRRHHQPGGDGRSHHRGSGRDHPASEAVATRSGLHTPAPQHAHRRVSPLPRGHPRHHRDAHGREHADQDGVPGGDAQPGRPVHPPGRSQHPRC